MIRVSIAGASGYAGGELLRLLLGHPKVEVAEITSERLAGKFAHGVHPNLRGVTRLRFRPMGELSGCDVLFVCLPHGESSRGIDDFRRIAGGVVDLGADFRLRDPAAYERWYGEPHPRPDLLGRFVYGIPELNREALRDADLVACAGCNATAAILALKPLATAGALESAVIEVLVGSSEAGAQATSASHHPERSGVARAFKPTGHRHQAEIAEALGVEDLHFSATSIEMVRGVLATCHVFADRALEDRELWQIYRDAYGGEPFVRIVKGQTGIHRYPEPGILAGTNYCDVGFERDPDTQRVVVMSALDNLMKGAAGQAVHAFNLMCGFEETAGLEFTGLHPL
ncbi:MAG: N-acetyl-gamma-glutamyl-phosphate reductase [Acidobacteria bacterium]|nr:N-acetyl-gamma-glutamyl-phosphate reductase [Acidobacteriota bacterium]MYE43905.1 N-acetyl-gamma-glutamyl-phosphate reductase [Acidobacteriota bacterium]